jgi:hypothetical protein
MGMAKRLYYRHRFDGDTVPTRDIDDPPRRSRVWQTPDGKIQLGNAEDRRDRREPGPDGLPVEPKGPSIESLVRRLATRDEVGFDPSGVRVGDLLDVTRDDGRVERRRVKYRPWQLGHGEWLVGVEGISGGYALARCWPVADPEARES